MPTVPIEENRVGLAAVTDAKLRPGDYTGTGLQAVGSGLATLGEALGGVSKDLQKKQQLIAAQRESDDAAAADAALKQSYTLYDTRAREILRSGDQAYYNRTGQAAVDAAGSMAVELGRYRDEARQRLDPHVAAMFDRMIVPRIDQDIAGIQTYANEQKRVWQGEQSGHVMEASAANALDHVGTPQFVDHVATGLRALDNRALVEGWDPARKIAAEHDYVSNIHKQAIDGLTVGDAIAADAYYRAHENEMTARDRAAIEQSLRQPLLERHAAAVIDTYGASVAGDSDGPAEPYAPRNADLPAIYAYLAEQDLPPEVEEAALNDAAARAAQNERRIAQDQRAARDTAFELTDRLGEGFTSITKLSPDVLRGLDPETRDSLARQARRNARPEPVEPHGKAAYDLTMLAATDRKAFVERDLRLDRDRMTPEDYDALNEAQQGWRSDPPAIGAVTRQRAFEAIGGWGTELGLAPVSTQSGLPSGTALPVRDGAETAPLPQNAVFTPGQGSGGGPNLIHVQSSIEVAEDHRFARREATRKIEQKLAPAKRRNILQEAERQIGSTNWADEVTRGHFGPDTNKCNLFVYEILTAAGASPGLPNGIRHPSPPSAGQWADPNFEIPGWVVLPANAKPQAGDVIAQQIDYADATGHVMIIGRNGMVIGTGSQGMVRGPDGHMVPGPHGTIEHIRRPASLGGQASGGRLVYRRWVGA